MTASTTTTDKIFEQLGVGSCHVRSILCARTRALYVSSGRELLTNESFLRSAFVGSEGVIEIIDQAGTSELLEAPFLIDFWAADADRRSRFGAVAVTDLTLAVIDHSKREEVFCLAPRLSQLSAQSEGALGDPMTRR